MDPETAAHIEAQRRPPEQKEPRKLSGEPMLPHKRKISLPEREAELERERAAAGIPAAGAEGKSTPVPAAEYVQKREERERERVIAKLDQIAPATVRELATGPQLEIRVRCGGCGAEVTLVSKPDEEYPDLDPESLGSLKARMVAVGHLRTAPIAPGGRFSGVMCDPCERKATQAERDREIANDQASRLADACLPAALQGFEFDQMEPTGFAENDRMTAISAARTWAAKKRVEEKPGLLIFGKKGSGKTRLAATTAWQRLRSHSVRWVSWPALAGQLLGAFDDDDRKVAMSVLHGTQALVLDDIARDNIEVSDWMKTQLFTAIDKRVQAGVPLLLTTNLTGTRSQPDNPLAALGERLGGSVASRLAGYCRVVELPGADNRLRFTYDGKEPKTAAEREAAAEGLQEPEESEE